MCAPTRADGKRTGRGADEISCSPPFYRPRAIGSYGEARGHTRRTKISGDDGAGYRDEGGYCRDEGGFYVSGGAAK